MCLLQIDKKYGEAKLAELNQEAAQLREWKQLPRQARKQVLA
jgi:hypothetical protein